MPLYECSGCGVINDDPEKYLETIRDTGSLLCYPERKMIKISESDDKESLSSDKINRFRTGTENIITLSDKAFDKLTEIIESPSEPTSKLLELMKSKNKRFKSPD